MFEVNVAVHSRDLLRCELTHTVVLAVPHEVVERRATSVLERAVEVALLRLRAAVVFVGGVGVFTEITQLERGLRLEACIVTKHLIHSAKSVPQTERVTQFVDQIVTEVVQPETLQLQRNTT